MKENKNVVLFPKPRRIEFFQGNFRGETAFVITEKHANGSQSSVCLQPSEVSDMLEILLAAPEVKLPQAP